MENFSKNIFIKDFKPKDNVDELFLVKYMAVMESRDGRSYLNMILSDSSGDIEARKWKGAESAVKLLEKGDIVRVKGKINLYQGRYQLIIGEIDKDEEKGREDMSKFVPSAESHPDKMFDDLLKIVVTHNGISGDNDLELATWKLLLEETDGDVLTTAEANSIIANLYVYNDDGTSSGSYDAGDTVEITVSTLSLASGIQTITFTDNAGDTAITATNSKTFFIVVEMTSDATSQGIDSLRVSFDPDAHTVNEDRTEDSSISVQDSSEVNTGNIGIPEFSTLLAPILSVLLIVNYNFRRRRTNPVE